MIRMTPKRAFVGFLLSFGLGLAAWGCQKKEQTAAPAPAAAAAPQPTAAAAPAEPTTAPAAAPSSAAIASADGEQPGRKVEVTELKRLSGGTISLKFTMINDANDEIVFNGDYAEANHSKDFGSIGGVSLEDPVGKKKYLVVRDSDGNCLCSRGIPNIAKKSRLNLWAKFPAPPEDVKKISISIPHFAPMDDAPISQ
jgi:hypothetical protein